jgi:hypothetical protein
MTILAYADAAARGLPRNSRKFLLTGLAVLFACSDAPDAERSVVAGPPLGTLPAEAAWDTLEARLLDIDPRQVQFVVEAEGGPDARLRGALVLLGAEGLEINADGVFDDQPRALRLAADERSLSYGNGVDSTVVTRPAGLEEAVVIGFARAGLFPQLQRLAAGMPIDYLDGGARDRLVMEGVAWGPSETVEGRPAISLDFTLRIGDGPAGVVRLYLDEETGLPLLRRQVVESPEGDSSVTESYEFF